MSKRVFRDAGFLYMLRGILAASCDNLRGKSFRDEVAETGGRHLFPSELTREPYRNRRPQ